MYYYTNEKRKKEDLCNICGKYKRLTWDHVPPKCCNNHYPIKTNPWTKGMPQESKYAKKYQNGIRFRSLCEECNNKILGANFDIILEEFSNQIIQKMNNSSSIVKIPIKVNRLCRAICGHILATKNYYDNESLIDKELRKYVLDEKKLPPEGMSLLYWVYPYSTIIIMRDFCACSIYNKYEFPKGMLSIVNSFPCAYIISTKKEECGLFDLFNVCSSNIDEVVELSVDCRSYYFPNSKHLRPFEWPCNISDEKDGAAFVLGVKKNIDDSKIAVHSLESVNKIIAKK